MDIVRLIDESNEIFNFRCNYINKFKDKDNFKNEDFKNLVKDSKILANIKFKNCRYDPKIYYKLKKHLN